MALCLPGGALGGGGGGGALASRLLPPPTVLSSRPLRLSEACFCSIYVLIKSQFCSIWSSVMPICRSSSSNEGSTLAEGEALLAADVGAASGKASGDEAMGCGIGILGADEDL